jgi:peptidoglycan/LPS O-acetylase OafA/YrhL
VSIFFAISGFVITLSLEDKLQNSGGASLQERLRSAKGMLFSFYKRRFFRIFPMLFFVMLLVGLYLNLADDSLNWLFPLLRAPIEVVCGVYNNSVELFVGSEKIHCGGFGPFWTLAVEAQFYILWPLVLLLCKNNCTRSILALSLGCLFLLVIRPLTGAFFGEKYYLIHNNLSELFLGSFLAFLYRGDSLGQSKAGVWAKQVALLLALVVWCYPGTVNKAFFSGTVTSLASVLIVAMAVFYEGSFNLPLLGRIFGFLGSRSFSFYAVQLVLANLTTLYIGSVFFPGETPAGQEADLYQFMIFIVALFVTTEFVWRFIEKPSAELGRK